MTINGEMVFESWELAKLKLRNRVIRAATYEGRTPGGKITDEQIDFHRDPSAGGVAMTTVAYGAVSKDARTFDDQIVLSEDEIPNLKRLTEAVQSEGAAASIQLAHAGGFTRATGRSTWASRAPSSGFNTYGLMSGSPFMKSLTTSEMDEIVKDYVRAAAVAREAGFDAVEVHMGHGYLLSQFLSPALNHRRDQYGGTTNNRTRFPRRVAEALRKELGTDFPILAKVNLSDGVRGGLCTTEATEVACHLESTGLNALVLSGGIVSKSPMFLFRGGSPLKAMVAVESSAFRKAILRIGGARMLRELPFEELFFLDQARQIRAAVDMPLVLIGGVRSRANIEKAIAEGFDAVAMGRPLIHNPNLINEFKSGQSHRSLCDNCNRCVGEMESAHGVVCVTRRETQS